MDDPVGTVLGTIVLFVVASAVFCFVGIVLGLYVQSRYNAQEASNDGAPVSNEPSTSRPVAVSNPNRNMIGLQYDIESFEATAPSFHEIQQVRTQLDRQSLIRSRLHFQIVLPDLSNANVESLREAADTKAQDGTMTDIQPDDDGDDSSIVERKDSSTTPSSMSLYHRVQDLFSLRSFRPRKVDVCSVCLEGFQPGQTICAAKNSCCRNTFHADCLWMWLEEHNDCPLCRSNIV